MVSRQVPFIIKANAAREQFIQNYMPDGVPPELISMLPVTDELEELLEAREFILNRWMAISEAWIEADKENLRPKPKYKSKKFATFFNPTQAADRTPKTADPSAGGRAC